MVNVGQGLGEMDVEGEEEEGFAFERAERSDMSKEDGNEMS
jgi:hypothetical protein